MRRPGLHGRARRGAAIVELAFAFPLLATILIVLADLSVFLFLQQALVERARSAARWGAVNDPANTAAIVNMVLYGQATAPGDGTRPGFGLSPEMVSVSAPDTDTDQHRLIVTISGYSFRLLSPVLAGSYAGRTIQVSVPLGPYG